MNLKNNKKTVNTLGEEKVRQLKQDHTEEGLCEDMPPVSPGRVSGGVVPAVPALGPSVCSATGQCVYVI